MIHTQRLQFNFRDMSCYNVLKNTRHIRVCDSDPHMYILPLHHFVGICMYLLIMFNYSHPCMMSGTMVDAPISATSSD